MNDLICLVNHKCLILPHLSLNTFSYACYKCNWNAIDVGNSLTFDINNDFWKYQATFPGTCMQNYPELIYKYLKMIMDFANEAKCNGFGWMSVSKTTWTRQWTLINGPRTITIPMRMRPSDKPRFLAPESYHDYKRSRSLWDVKLVYGPCGCVVTSRMPLTVCIKRPF